MSKSQHPSNSSCYHEDHELLDAGLFPQQSNCCGSVLFEELNHFRNKIEEGRSGLHQFPFTVNRGKVTIYQTVFLLLSVIFFGSAIHLYFSHFNWVYHMIFSGMISLKSFLLLICTGLGVATSGIALSIKPEIEIAEYCFRRAHRKIKKIYRRRLTLSHCVHYTSPKGMCALRKGNTTVFEDINDKLSSIREEVRMTLKRIRLSKTLDETLKERLYNQSILELQFQLERLVTAYKNNELTPVQ